LQARRSHAPKQQEAVFAHARTQALEQGVRWLGDELKLDLGADSSGNGAQTTELQVRVAQLGESAINRDRAIFVGTSLAPLRENSHAKKHPHFASASSEDCRRIRRNAMKSGSRGT